MQDITPMITTTGGRSCTDENKGNAFFKLVNFYARDIRYKQSFGKFPIDLVGEWAGGTVRNEVVKFILKNRSFFHKGVNFDYQQ